MIEYNFEENVNYWVGLTAHAFKAALNRELADTGVTMRQVEVLACLALEGELAQVDIAEMLHVDPSTLVRVLDRMERDGWVVRHESPVDRRKKVIRATEKVSDTWARIVECGQRIQHRATRGLSDSRIQQLKDTLATIRHNLGEE